MTHLDTELKSLKSTLTSMWLLVNSQLERANEAIIGCNKELANMINANEKRIDAFELKVNMDCENILALFNPVAIDLRFVMAVMKINYNLERIGDYARSIGNLTDFHGHYDKKLLEESRVFDMFKLTASMMNDTLYAFENEDSYVVHTIFQRDEELDKINKKADKVIGEWIVKNPGHVQDGLNLLTIVRKLERVGDQSKNIALEIIFHLEAKVLRHTKKSKLMEELERKEKAEANAEEKVENAGKKKGKDK